MFLETVPVESICRSDQYVLHKVQKACLLMTKTMTPLECSIEFKAL